MLKHKRTKMILIALALIIALSAMLAAPGLAAWGARQLTAHFMDIRVSVNGQFIETGVEPFIVDGTTYLPVRTVAEAIGMDVGWDQDTSTIHLQDPDVRVIGATPVIANGDFGAFLALLTEITGADLTGFAGRTATAYNVAAAANTAAGNVNLENSLIVRDVADAAVVAAKAANLLPSSYSGTFTAAELNETAFQVAAYLGLTRGYVGRTTDEDIFTKLDIVWNAIPAAMIVNDELSAIGARLLDEGVATGFSIRSKVYAVNFAPERTLLYSHSNLTHVKQLVALLNSQGITARIALEPKTSWYEWEGLQYGPEFDLQLEFVTVADKAKFDGLVLTYAQRSDDVDRNELLAGSWWTPMYASAVSVGDSYVEVVNHFAYINGTGLYLTSTGPKGALSDAVVEIIEDMGATAERTPQFVNSKFYYGYLDELLPVEDAA